MLFSILLVFSSVGPADSQSVCRHPARPREPDMTDHLEPKERAGTSVAIHDRFEGGATGVAAWLPALNTAERPMSVRDRVPASALHRRVHTWLPFRLSAFARGRTQVDRMTRAREASNCK